MKHFGCFTFNSARRFYNYYYKNCSLRLQSEVNYPIYDKNHRAKTFQLSLKLIKTPLSPTSG